MLSEQTLPQPTSTASRDVFRNRVHAGIATNRRASYSTGSAFRRQLQAGSGDRGLVAARDHGRGFGLVLAVVDPGVGSERDAVVLQADGQQFVGPDNGLLPDLKGLDRWRIKRTIGERALVVVLVTKVGRTPRRGGDIRSNERMQGGDSRSER
jgi:hypothetical protein